MKIRVLGCSGAIAKDCRTTSFLIDQDVLIDAGTGVGDLTLEEMRGISDVFLTHAHLDHIAALPLMVDSIAASLTKPLRLHALPGTIAALRAHIFNGAIWPDFSRIPSAEHPFISFHEVAVGQVLQIGNKHIEVLPAVHIVPAVGYAVSAGQGAWVFSGDTERNPAFWQRVNQLPVAMLVIETAFSNHQQGLARLSLHLSPVSLAQELALIAPDRIYPIYITHTKPAEADLIMNEILEFEQATAVATGNTRDIRWLKAGQEFNL